jgi:nitrous oxidase accessory protein
MLAWRTLLLLAVMPMALVTGSAAFARVIDITPTTGLAAAIANAAAGDTIRLAPGSYAGPVTIGKALTIEGRDPGSTLVTGNGEGSVLRVTAPGVTIRRLTLSGSGANSTDIDAGIYVADHADNPVIENNLLSGNLFGISLHGVKGAVVRGNTVRNRNDLWLNNRGNGIHLWNNAGAVIEDNDIEGGRDAVYVQLGSGNVVRGNRMRQLRFAVHFMYSKQGAVSDNVSVGNHIAYALMYSDGLKVEGNMSYGDRDTGLALNSARKGTIAGNYVARTSGPCLFFYLSIQNVLAGNRFEGCAVGVRVTGSESNVIHDNAFIGNHAQMHYAGTKSYEWSNKGRGNYWSDNPAFDLDGDGMADTAYRPNDVVDWITWRYPLSKLLLSSPSLQILRVSQSQFPAFYPGGIVDSHPLMTPPPAPMTLPDISESITWAEGQSDTTQ